MTGGLGSISRAPIYESVELASVHPESTESTLAGHEFSVRTFLPGLYTIESPRLVYRSLRFLKLSQVLMSAHEQPLFVAMRVLLALSAVVENGYDWDKPHASGDTAPAAMVPPEQPDISSAAAAQRR